MELESTLEAQLVGRCLEMWQALAYAKPVTGDLVRAWQLAMARHGVTEAEFREAAQRLLDRREFPAPADALEIVGRIRFEAARLDPPCVEVLDERGGVRLASRSAAAGRQAFERPVRALEGPRRPISEVFEDVRRRRSI